MRTGDTAKKGKVGFAKKLSQQVVFCLSYRYLGGMTSLHIIKNIVREPSRLVRRWRKPRTLTLTRPNRTRVGGEGQRGCGCESCLV